MGDLSKNFNREEFACKCGCGHDNVSPVLVNLLQEIRDYIDRAVHVHSGCRCEAHNKAVGGVSNSAHITGEAADIYVHGWEAETLGGRIKKLREAGHLRDLTYCYLPGRMTVHVGVDRKPRNKIFGW